MKFFLRIRAWQLFALIILPFLLFAFSLDQTTPTRIFLSAPICEAILLGWIWSIGIESNSRLPPELRKSTKWYSGGLCFVLACSYIFAIVITLNQGWFPGVLVPFHLAAMYFSFYGLWFTAKQFTTLRRQKSLGFADYAGTFFLIWFFLIGVWFIQPEVNRVLGDEVVVAS